MIELVERSDASVISAVEPLCRELHLHHESVAPTLAGIAHRSADECWARKKQGYEHWLAEGAFVLLAVENQETIGFALVRITSGYDGWKTDDRVAMLEALSVSPERRARGVGRLLLKGVTATLEKRDIKQMRVQFIDANVDAQEFYLAGNFTTVINEMFVDLQAAERPPMPENDGPLAIQYELQVASWVYSDTQAILSRMAMLVAADSVFLALTMEGARSASTPPLAYTGAVLLVLAILALLVGCRHLWGIPIEYTREKRRPQTLRALAAQTSQRVEWVTRNKVRWLHLGAILTFLGIIFTGGGFLLNVGG